MRKDIRINQARKLGMTYREAKVFDFIVAEKTLGHKGGPSFDEIRTMLDLKGRGATMRTLNSLKAKGYLSWVPYHTRTFETHWPL